VALRAAGANCREGAARVNTAAAMLSNGHTSPGRRSFKASMPEPLLLDDWRWVAVLAARTDSQIPDRVGRLRL